MLLSHNFIEVEKLIEPLVELPLPVTRAYFHDVEDNFLSFNPFALIIWKFDLAHKK